MKLAGNEERNPPKINHLSAEAGRIGLFVLSERFTSGQLAAETRLIVMIEDRLRIQTCRERRRRRSCEGRPPKGPILCT